MSDLRNLLDREAGRISARPDALDGVIRRTERRHRTRRVVAGATALAVVAVVAVGGWSILRDRPEDGAPSGTGAWQGIWPHTSRAEAEQAQAAVDGGDAGLAWQATFSEVGSRYLRENHDWSVVAWGEDAERTGPSKIRVYAATCELDDCKDPGPAGGRHQEVQLTLEQLVRSGDGGVWTVTDVVGPSSALVRSQFGYGRVIMLGGAVDDGGGFDCPTGDLAAPTEAETQAAIESFLRASNGDAPDPEAAWNLLEPSVRASLGPYEIFAHHMRTLPAEPYDVWNVDAVDAGDVYNVAALEESCPGIGGFVSEAYVTFPGDPMQGIPTQFTFIGHADGPKLWRVS